MSTLTLQGKLVAMATDLHGLIGVEVKDHHYDALIDADRLATALCDHFLDREKVRAALHVAIRDAAIDRPVADDDLVFYANQPNYFSTDLLVDRLIAGLAGGSE